MLQQPRVGICPDTSLQTCSSQSQPRLPALPHWEEEEEEETAAEGQVWKEQGACVGAGRARGCSTAGRDGTGQDGRAQLSLPPGTAWGGQQQPRAGGFAPCTLIQHRPHVSVCSASSASHGGTQELSPAAGSCLRAGCWGCCGHLGDPAAVPRGAVAMRRARGRGAAVPRAGQRGHNCPVGPRGWGHQGMGAGRGRWHPEMPQRGLAMPVMPPEISR